MREKPRRLSIDSIAKVTYWPRDQLKNTIGGAGTNVTSFPAGMS